ncbi:hypothetical protein L227DRAFT_568866, partial [Lentinus tigrinus ALCF2SS1-6]
MGMRNLLREFRAKLRVGQLSSACQRTLRSGKEFSPFDLGSIITLPEGVMPPDIFPETTGEGRSASSTNTTGGPMQDNEVIVADVALDLESLAKEAHESQEAGEDAMGSGPGELWNGEQEGDDDASSVASWESLHDIARRQQRKDRTPAEQRAMNRSNARRRKCREQKQAQWESGGCEGAPSIPAAHAPKGAALKYAAEATVIDTQFDMDGGGAKYAGAGFTGKPRRPEEGDKGSVPFEHVASKMRVIEWDGTNGRILAVLVAKSNDVNYAKICENATDHMNKARIYCGMDGHDEHRRGS